MATIHETATPWRGLSRPRPAAAGDVAVPVACAYPSCQGCPVLVLAEVAPVWRCQRTWTPAASVGDPIVLGKGGALPAPGATS